MKLKADIMELVQRYNEQELKRRKDYYEYLCKKEPQTETFEEHVERYAQIIRVGDQASADDIHALENLIKVQLPQELQEFYSTIGKLMGGNYLCIFPIRELLRRLHSETRFDKISSMGLIDMIKSAWGNDRFEFDSANGCLTQNMIETLNRTYTCIGWIFDEGSCEEHIYVYFGRSGIFGSVLYRQDGFDEFYKNYLVPMFENSTANQTLSETIVNAWEWAVEKRTV